MRLKYIPNSENIVRRSSYVINNPKEYKSKWSKLFNNNNPIYVEIGTGRGKFIVENALNYPNVNYVGIEKYPSALITCIKRLEDLKLNNLKLICMDAKEIEDVFYKEIDKIYLTFSDPWPKNRHEKRRLTYLSFLQKYDNLFKKECEIILKTDNDLFFDYSMKSFVDYGYEIIKIDRNYKDDIKTEFEEKYIKEGKNINYLIVKK